MPLFIDVHQTLPEGAIFDDVGGHTRLTSKPRSGTAWRICVTGSMRAEGRSSALSRRRTPKLPQPCTERHMAWSRMRFTPCGKVRRGGAHHPNASDQQVHGPGGTDRGTSSHVPGLAAVERRRAPWAAQCLIKRARLINKERLINRMALLNSECANVHFVKKKSLGNFGPAREMMVGPS